MTNLVDAMPPVGLQVRSDVCRLLNNTPNTTKVGGVYAVDLSTIAETTDARFAFTKFYNAKATQQNPDQQGGIACVALEVQPTGGETLVQVNGVCKARIMFPAVGVGTPGTYTVGCSASGGNMGGMLYLTTGNTNYFTVSTSGPPAAAGTFKIFARMLENVSVTVAGGAVTGSTKQNEFGGSIATDGGVNGVFICDVLLLGVAGWTDNGVV